MPFTLEKATNIGLFIEMKSERIEGTGEGKTTNDTCQLFWLSCKRKLILTNQHVGQDSMWKVVLLPPLR